MCIFNDKQRGSKRLCSIPSMLYSTFNDSGWNFCRKQSTRIFLMSLKMVCLDGTYYTPILHRPRIPRIATNGFFFGFVAKA